MAGAWTGAIIAYLLDMPFGTAMGAILAGVVLAGGIMTVLTLAGKAGALPGSRGKGMLATVLSSKSATRAPKSS